MIMGEDKFFVVVMVISVIFIGLAVYLLLLDRKLSRIEKKQAEIFCQQKRSQDLDIRSQDKYNVSREIDISIQKKDQGSQDGL